MRRVAVLALVRSPLEVGATDDEEQARRRPSGREELRSAVRGLGLVLLSSPPLAIGLLVLTLAQGAAPSVVVGQTGRFLRAMPDAVRLGAG